MEDNRWLIVSAIAALAAIFVWVVLPRGKYRLYGLALAFWGLTVCLYNRYADPEPEGSAF